MERPPFPAAREIVWLAVKVLAVPVPGTASAVRALAAVVDPVPPLAIATVPVTFAALPAILPVTSDPGTVDDAVSALKPEPFT